MYRVQGVDKMSHRPPKRQQTKPSSWDPWLLAQVRTLAELGALTTKQVRTSSLASSKWSQFLAICFPFQVLYLYISVYICAYMFVFLLPEYSSHRVLMFQSVFHTCQRCQSGFEADSWFDRASIMVPQGFWDWCRSQVGYSFLWEEVVTLIIDVIFFQKIGVWAFCRHVERQPPSILQTLMTTFFGSEKPEDEQTDLGKMQLYV